MMHQAINLNNAVHDEIRVNNDKVDKKIDEEDKVISENTKYQS